MIVYMVEDFSTDDHANVACYSTQPAAEQRREEEQAAFASRLKQIYENRQQSIPNIFEVVPYEVLDG